MSKDRIFHEMVECLCRVRALLGESDCPREQAIHDEANHLLRESSQYIPPLEELKKWEQERRLER